MVGVEHFDFEHSGGVRRRPKTLIRGTQRHTAFTVLRRRALSEHDSVRSRGGSIMGGPYMELDSAASARVPEPRPW